MKAGRGLITLMMSAAWTCVSAAPRHWLSNKGENCHQCEWPWGVCMPALRPPHCNPWPLLPPPDGQPLNQDPVEVGALCLTACHCAMVLIFFFLPPLPEEMVSDWEQCVNSPVTLDKPARRPVTGTYGMFDRERGCESHWMIKWCFSPFGNVMLSGKRADHRSLKRLTPASLWHLLQGPELLSLAPRPILTLTVCAARSCSASLSECGTIIGYQFSLAMQAGERIHPKSALPLKLSKAAPAVLHPVSPRPVTRLTFLINTRTVSSSRC